MGRDRDRRAGLGVLQVIEEGVVVPGQQDGLALAGNADAGVVLVGADAGVQNFVRVAVVDRGVHVGAGDRDRRVAVPLGRVGDGAQRQPVRLGVRLIHRTAVDDGSSIIQQISGLCDLRCAEEPAQQGLVRGQYGVAHDKDQRGADQNKGQRDHYISQWTAAQKRVLLACLHGDMLSLLIWLIITASYIINYFLYKRKV